MVLYIFLCNCTQPEPQHVAVIVFLGHWLVTLVTVWISGA